MYVCVYALFTLQFLLCMSVSICVCVYLPVYVCLFLSISLSLCVVLQCGWDFIDDVIVKVSAVCFSVCPSLCLALYACVSLCSSPAAVDGRIAVGDVIVEVNAISLELMSDSEAVSTLRDAVRNSRQLITYSLITCLMSLHCNVLGQVCLSVCLSPAWL